MDYKRLVQKNHDVLNKYPRTKCVDITFSSAPVRPTIVCRGHSFSAISNVSKGFPARSPTYINTFKFNQRMNSATRMQEPILNEKAHKNIARYNCPRFPITYPDHHDKDTKMENWWRIVSDDDKPILKILNFSPFITTSSATPMISQAKQFQKKHFKDGVKSKMFIDNGKVLYFKNAGSSSLLPSLTDITKRNNLQELQGSWKKQMASRNKDNNCLKSTRKCQYEERRGVTSKSSCRLRRLLSRPQDKDSSRDNSNNEFTRSNSQAELHTKSFFLRTPEARSIAKKDYAICGCHLCAYERDLAFSQTRDDEHGIIYTITPHTLPIKFDMSFSTYYPPSRPNTALCQ